MGSNQGVRRGSGKIYLDSAYILNDIKKIIAELSVKSNVCFKK